MSDFELRGKSWLNKDEVIKRVKAATVKRVMKCGLLVEAEAKRSLSKGAIPVLERDASGKFKKATQFKGGPEGQPPRLRTGNLRASIATAQSGPESCIVGPAQQGWYGRVHEFGAIIKVTGKMAAFLRNKYGWNVYPGMTIRIPKRPFMRPALLACVAKFPEQFKDLPLGGVSGGAK